MEENVKNEKVLEVKNLRISFKTNAGTVKAVRGINFSLYKGRTLAIVGESGSGKSVTSKAILGILANNKIVENGQIIFDGKDLLRIKEDAFTHIRGVKISMIFQDPLSSLNPIMKVGKQLTEAMYLKSKSSVREGKAIVRKINKELKLFSKEDDYNKFIQTISPIKGDLTYEVLKDFRSYFVECIDNAIAKFKENLRTLDNKLTEIENNLFVGLDKFNFKLAKQGITSLKEHLKKARFAFSFDPDDIIDVFYVSFNEYLNSYKDSLKRIAEREELLKKYNAKDIYDVPPEIRAKEREIVVPPQEYYDNLVSLSDNLSKYIESLINNQELTGENLVEDIMRGYIAKNSDIYNSMTKVQAKERAISLLKEVGINDPERRYNQYPFEFSGGMRQRIVIAIALSSNPEVLICDEPTTALDVTIQSQILELINRLKEEKHLSIIFITHDLGVVANMADDIAVMYAGKIVEYGSVYDIFYDPRHPYTWALLGSMPDLETKEKLDAIPGTPPNMLLPPRGDAFAARNKFALKIDYEEEPVFYQVSPTHAAATWLLDDYAPDVEAPKIVQKRIFKSLKEDSKNKPVYDLKKNSILNKMEGEK